jgi:hypothetical protein
MIKLGSVNPLNVFGLRALEHSPPHFSHVTFDLRVSPKQITDWIYENLEGRFWFGDRYQYNEQTNKIHAQNCASFERAAEASYFALMLDQINTPQERLY